MPDNEKYHYQYPVDELDKMLEQIQMGIQPMISDDMQLELDMRYREMFEEATGQKLEEEKDESSIAKIKHQRIMKEKIENERKKASTKDVLVMKISDEQKAKIREQMSVSIVRPDPNDPYNLTDDKLFRDNESKKIMERLKGIKNCYYNQTDYTNAIGIIRDAVDYALGKTGHGEYPWMSYKEAVKEFNAGRIKFSWCAVPKLIVNRVSPITDPEILKGVVNGDVVLLNKNDDADNIRKINKEKMNKYNPINVDYNVTGEYEYSQMQAAHRAGYDTPWSTGIRYKATSYDPSAMPFLSIFGNNNTVKNDKKPLLYDWERDGAGREYYDLIHGRSIKTNDITAVLNKDNNGLINPIIGTNMNQFLQSMKTINDNSGGYNYSVPNFLQSPSQNPNNFNQDAAMIEKQLLDSISMNNPLR